MPTVVQAAQPALQGVYPRGAQRGTRVELVLVGQRLGDAREVLWYRPGLQTVALQPRGARQVRVSVQIAPDCPLGEHPLRLITASGVSELRTFWVGALPVVAEKENNDTIERAQPVELERTIYGRITTEDQDHFVFSGKKGQRVTAEIEGMRLATTFFDPHLSLLDARRFELAACDDTPLLGQDPHLSVTLPADGKYYVRLRESAFGGNGASWYRLHLGTFPRPTGVYPPGGPPGKPLQVELLGAGLRQEITPPAGAMGRQPVFAGLCPSPNWIWVSENRNVLEREPNDAVGQATDAGALPAACNGIIGRPGDVDCFAFQARRGQVFHARVFARQLGSPLDPVLTFHETSGRYLAGNDDAGGADSYVRFAAPRDGRFVVRIHDHLRRGGAAYVYRIEFYGGRALAVLSLRKYGRFSQVFGAVPVPQGNRYAALVQAMRVELAGDLVVGVVGLPRGLRVLPAKMVRGTNLVPLVFEAAADAPQAGALARMTAASTDKRPLASYFQQSAELVLGNPNQTPYHAATVDRLAVAVTQAVPFRIELVAPKAPLVRDGALSLRVLAHRAPGFKAPIEVRLLWNPPGVSSARSVRIAAGEARLPLTAGGRARTGKWGLVALGWARVGDADVHVASQPVEIEVAQPFVQITMNRAGAVQGQAARIAGTLKHLAPFAGKATVRLLGAPPGTTVVPPAQEITSATKQIEFKVQTQPGTRPGRYRNLFCQVVLQVAGEQVVQRVAGRTELMVHRPPPPKLQRKAAPPAPGNPAPKQPLSRLEQLRAQHKGEK